MVMSEKLVSSIEVVVRSDGERMDDHVGSEVDVFSLVFLHNSLEVVSNLGFDGVHVLVEYSPVKDLISRSLGQTLLGIPVKSVLLVHGNIALLVRIENVTGSRARHSVYFSIVD
jgi:hypothetical protein